MQLEPSSHEGLYLFVGAGAAIGALIQGFGIIILNDLRSRVARIEDLILKGKPILTYGDRGGN